MTAPDLAMLRALPDEALVPVSWVRELVGGQNGADSDGDPGIVADLTVGDVGQQFGRTPACVRAWCRAGRVPGAYRLNGREWRIPRGGLRAFLAGERNGQGSKGPRREGVAVDLGAWRKGSMS